ncbi:MAG: hypothetical protein LBU91_08345 [Bacteroidales bacterium]|jgi:hypothetical protein|nr:hypothetical protein [Bacteroidales bacterium]
MNTTFYFTSAQEITPNILDIIRQAYQEKPVSIYIREDDLIVPNWQMQEVRRREENNTACLLDFDMVIGELEKELETV